MRGLARATGDLKQCNSSCKDRPGQSTAGQSPAPPPHLSTKLCLHVSVSNSAPTKVYGAVSAISNPPPRVDKTSVALYQPPRPAPPPPPPNRASAPQSFHDCSLQTGAACASRASERRASFACPRDASVIAAWEWKWHPLNEGSRPTRCVVTLRARAIRMKALSLGGGGKNNNDNLRCRPRTPDGHVRRKKKQKQKNKPE